MQMQKVQGYLQAHRSAAVARPAAESATFAGANSEAKRNLFQFHRYQRCLHSGMVLETVCEDHMPGGRNGSVIYNVCRMKYRKAKRMHTSPYSPPAEKTNTAAMVIQRGGDYSTAVFELQHDGDKSAVAPPPSSSSGFCASSSASPSSFSAVSASSPCVASSTAVAVAIPPRRSDQAGGYLSPGPDDQMPSTSREHDDTHIEELTPIDDAEEQFRPVHISPGGSPTRDPILVHSAAAVLSPRHRDFSRSTPMRKNLIQKLIEIDRLESLINLRGLKLRSSAQAAAETVGAAQRLSHIGDEIVEQLVEWTKTLPFYSELPVEVHTHLLTQRWAELVLLSACFFAYCMSESRKSHNIHETQQHPETLPDDVGLTTHANLRLLQQRLSAVMSKHIPFEHVSKEAGPLVETFTELYQSFCRLRITLEAYVCLKVITILHYTPPVYENEDENIKSAKIHALYARKVCAIQDQFVKALQIHLSQCEDGPRLSEILNWQPALRMAGTTLLQSKMFYVPFLICKAPCPLPDTPPSNAAGVTRTPTDAFTNGDEDENPPNDETDCEDDEDGGEHGAPSFSAGAS